jgi:O-antigen/teichoic acid export membrane protein
MADQGLKDKTVKGVGWSAADAFLGHGVSFIVGIVLARILSPVEYGLIGIVLIFTTVLNGIVDSGFSNALIRKKDATDKDYNTMFITNMAASLSLYVLLWFCAPLISQFFEREELTTLTRATGLILILQGLSITQVTILTKRIDFKTRTKASIVAAVFSGIVGIGMAYSGFGVWSLVGQQLSNKCLHSVCLWVLNRWLPNGTFSRESFKYMWGFGWKIMLSGLLDSIWGQLYRVVVGKCYSPTTLGQYSRSGEYANLFSQSITGIVRRVTFPVLAEVQDDSARMVSAYRRIIKTVMLVTCTCMISMGAVAEPLIYSLIGEKWLEAATFLPLICISMSLYPLHAINLNMLQVQGRSDIFLYLEIIKKVISFGPLCIGVFVGIYWMLVGSIVAGIIAFFLNSYYTGKRLNYSSWMQLKDVAPSYFVAFTVAFSVYFIKYLPLSCYAVLTIQIAIGLAVFYTVCESIKPSEYIELKGLAQTNLRKLIRKK